MHDCIRVTALLECFKWTWNKPHNRGEWHQPCYECKAVWGQLLVLLVLLWLIFKGCVPVVLNHQWYWNGVWSLCFHIQDWRVVKHAWTDFLLINTWARTKKDSGNYYFFWLIKKGQVFKHKEKYEYDWGYLVEGRACIHTSKPWGLKPLTWLHKAC